MSNQPARRRNMSRSPENTIYVMQVEKLGDPGRWVEINREGGPGGGQQCVDLMMNYYHHHYPRRNLRVITSPGGEIIATAQKIEPVTLVRSIRTS